MKITKTTFKTFIKKNAEKLLIENQSTFDGMDDCVRACEGGFRPAVRTERNVDNTFGIEGAWLVGGGRDYFEAFEDAVRVGIRVFNCCGSFVIATPKAA